MIAMPGLGFIFYAGIPLNSFKLPAQMRKTEYIALQFILNNKGFAIQCIHLSRPKYEKIKTNQEN